MVYGRFDSRFDSNEKKRFAGPYNRLACIGGVKLAGFDRISFYATTHTNRHFD